MQLFRACLKVHYLFNAYCPMGAFRIAHLHLNSSALVRYHEMPNNKFRLALCYPFVQLLVLIVLTNAVNEDE
jgi:hypothetical protein